MILLGFSFYPLAINSHFDLFLFFNLIGMQVFSKFYFSQQCNYPVLKKDGSFGQVNAKILNKCINQPSLKILDATSPPTKYAIHTMEQNNWRTKKETESYGPTQLLLILTVIAFFFSSFFFCLELNGAGRPSEIRKYL